MTSFEDILAQDAGNNNNRADMEGMKRKRTIMIYKYAYSTAIHFVSVRTVRAICNSVIVKIVMKTNFSIQTLLCFIRYPFLAYMMQF